MTIKKLSIKILVTSLSILLISGCQNGSISKEGVGTAVGAVTGGILGSAFGKHEGKTAAILLGSVAGSFIGNSIGASLDKADRMYYEKTTMHALETVPSGQVSTWKNPDSGNWGALTPTTTYQSNNGEYCREYTQKIVIANKVQEGYGKACRSPDGSWKIVQ